MSAIVGFLGLDGRPAKGEALERMVERLAHRGPDGRSIWLEGVVGLGHCMLHTTPESLHEHLPLQRDGMVITADARIDNREELIDALRLTTHPLEHLSDSELVLYCYQRWGEECPTRLLGDFAFAIWDSSKQHLFCARDYFGVKPFYYYYQPDQRFIFATEIKAIFCYEDIPRRLNEIKISDYMLGMFEDKVRTFYTGINRLPPASAMVVGKRGIRQHKYWELDSQQEIKLKSDAEYAEAYRNLFVEAVRCRLRSAFPIGSMLSGGLDSSSIACVARDLLANRGGQHLHTFSIIFNQVKKSDEREYVYKVLEQGNFVAHFVEGDEATPFDDLDKVLWYQDEPFYAPNHFLNWRTWQSVNENRVRVLLDGFLGDNVISHGVEYLNELANQWRWLTLAWQLKQYLQRSNRKVSLLEPLKMYFIQQGIKPYIPDVGLTCWRKLKGNPIDPIADKYEYFKSDFSRRVALRDRLTSSYQYDRSIKSARQAHYDLLNNGMIQTALEIYNKGCSSFELETRIPYIDKRLVEFCLATPGNQKINRGFTRIITRRAMKGILPEDICWRTGKGDLSWGFLNGFNAGYQQVNDQMDSSDLFLNQFFNLKHISNMKDNYKKGAISHEKTLMLFLIAILVAWNNQACFYQASNN